MKFESARSKTALTALLTTASVATGKFAGVGSLTATRRQLVQKAEGLAELRNNPDQDASREKQARDYLARYKTATGAAAVAIEREREALLRQMVAIHDAARTAAGWEKLTNPTEIRQALLRLDQKGRDEALKSAAKNGRGEVFASLEGVESWLWGGSTLPLDKHIDDCCESIMPGFRDKLETIESARKCLDLGAKYFGEFSESLRDPFAEDRQQQAAERHRAAVQKLSGDVAA